MKWFIRKFIWNLISAPIVHQIDWTAEERASWDLFIRSSCGIKLFELLRQTVATKTFNAVCRESAGANAEARGAQELFALLHRLRNFPTTEREQYNGLVSEPTTPMDTDAIGRRLEGWSGGNSAI